MNKLVRPALLVVMFLCVPMIVLPDVGLGRSNLGPLAVMFVASVAAIFWPTPGEEQP